MKILRLFVGNAFASCLNQIYPKLNLFSNLKNLNGYKSQNLKTFFFGLS